MHGAGIPIAAPGTDAGEARTAGSERDFEPLRPGEDESEEAP